MKTGVPLAVPLLLACGTSLVSSNTPHVTSVVTAADERVSYAVLLGDRRLGTMTVARESGALTTHFEYGYLGNGASLNERVLFDAKGLPRAIDTSGNDFRKNPVDEHFKVENGTATWDNATEHGTAPAGPLYVPVALTPEDYVILAYELAVAAQGRATLLPTGAVVMRTITRREFAAGSNRTVATLFAFDGLDLHPVYVWLDQDRQLFFNVDAAYSPATVREGFESAVPEIMRAQGEADDQWQAALALRVGRPLTHPVVIRHARLFAAEDATMKSDYTVVLRDGRITSVGPDRQITIPPGAEIIEASGRTLLPGLWDMHQHLSGVDGILDIAAGVTAVRDLANAPRELHRLMDGYANGTKVGPRVIRSGLVDGPGSLSQPGAVIVRTEDEGRRAVDDYAADGYTAIKIYGSMSPSLVPVVAERAHAKGLRVSGHVPAQMTAMDAVRAGYDEINHIPFLILSLAGPVESSNIAALTAAFAQRGSLVDPASPPSRQLIAFLKEHRTVIDPTLYVFERLLSWRKGSFGPGYERIGDRFPLQPRRVLLNGGAPVPGGMEERYRKTLDVSATLVKDMHDAGVPIVVGTDFGVCGFSAHREIELDVLAGIPAPDVLQMATLGAARVAREEHELGSIAPGKLADLVLIDGDPTTDISDIRRPTLVVTRGRAYEPAKLLAELGIRP